MSKLMKIIIIVNNKKKISNGIRIRINEIY